MEGNCIVYAGQGLVDESASCLTSAPMGQFIMIA
jgi:hypothetical protein